MSKIIRSVLFAAGIAALPATAVLARSDKPVTVRLPASSLKDPAARLCMPKTILRSPAADQPSTLCQTQAEWSAAGVSIVAR